MPRKGIKSQPLLHKPSTSGATRLNQTTIIQSLGRSQKAIENVDELVEKCVRFILYRAGNNLPIRRCDIQKHVLPNVSRNFDRILNTVADILRKDWGFSLYLNNESVSYKQYLVSNTLPYKANTGNITVEDDNIDEEHSAPADTYKILIMLVLTHIFMSNNNVSEASLFSFLRSIQIDPDERHELFGNVKDFINATMVKQKYLNTEIEQISRRVCYVWGPRAEQEISKRALLEFVCKIYKDRQPKSWTSQFEIANAQAVEEGARVITEDSGIEVEEE